MKQVTNLYTQPLELEDGTILAAAGSDGSTKTVDSLGEKDNRLLEREWISVRDQGLKAVPSKPTADRRPATGEQQSADPAAVTGHPSSVATDKEQS
jgi:hypothetical protein